MSKPIPKPNKSNKIFDTNELGINDEIEFLKKENEYLKIELAYLKKLKALGLKDPRANNK